jgi:hypothetical protein
MKAQAILGFLLVCLEGISAFMVYQPRSSPDTSLEALDRRLFLETSVTGLLTTTATSAFALEDIGEMTAEEKEAAEVGRH